MNTKIFRGLKARKHLKRAQREWSRTVRALHPSNPHRASVWPWRSHERYVRARNRAYVAYWVRGEVRVNDLLRRSLARRFDDIGLEVTEEHVILEECVS